MLYSSIPLLNLLRWTLQVSKEEESCRHITHMLEQSLTKLWSSSFGALLAFSLCASLCSAQSTSSSVSAAVITLPYWLSLPASAWFWYTAIFTAARPSQPLETVFPRSWLSVEQVLQERHWPGTKSWLQGWMCVKNRSSFCPDLERTRGCAVPPQHDLLCCYCSLFSSLLPYLASFCIQPLILSPVPKLGCGRPDTT